MRCEREGAYSAAFNAFSAAADNMVSQIEAEKESCSEFSNLQAMASSDTPQDKSPPSAAVGCQPDQAPALLPNLTKEHQQVFQCLQGKARCALQAGELQKGLQLAQDLDNPQMYKACAEILLGMHQDRHAAAMLSKAGETERAAALYIQASSHPPYAATVNFPHARVNLSPHQAALQRFKRVILLLTFLSGRSRRQPSNFFLGKSVVTAIYKLFVAFVDA